MPNTYEITACPVCGSASQHTVADADDIRNEVEALWAFHTPRMAPTADPRRLMDRVAFSQYPPVRVAQCDGCAHIFRNPRERGIAGIYGGEDVEPAVLEALFDAQRTSFEKQVRRLSSLRPRPGAGLEIGSYVGAFLDAARQNGWNFDGVDVNEHAVAFARERGFRVHAGTINSIDTVAQYNVIAFWNCFEQLPDIREAARAAHARLRSNGLLTVRVPNGGWWLAVRRFLRGPATYVARAALAQNNLLSFPYRNGFTEKSLRTLLNNAGFTVERVFGEFSLPTSAQGAPAWAKIEGRALHSLIRAMRPISGAPWMELYATKRELS